MKRMYLPDDVNVMDILYNTNALDVYIADVEQGHDHDGVNSALIDPVNFDWLVEWIKRLERRVDQHDIDIAELYNYYYTFYEQFKIHNHTGAQTIWIEMFRNRDKMDADNSTMMLTPPRQLACLPSDYRTGAKYYYVSKPFDLTPDPWPEEDKPTTAKGVIVAKQKGQFIPYLVIGDTLTPDPSLRLRYPNAVPGRAGSTHPVALKTASKHDFQGKLRGNPTPNPSEAYSWVGKGWQTQGPGDTGIPGGWPRPNKTSPHFPFRGELSQAEYNTLNYRDNVYVVSSDKGDTDRPVYDAADSDVDPDPLYNGRDRVLCWHKPTNRYYWYNADNNSFTIIADNKLGPIPDPDVMEVAGGYDENTDRVYILKTQIRRVTRPAGYFDTWHQIIRWKPDTTEFVEGPWWKSMRAKAAAWPANVIAPTRLEIYGGKMYIITETDFGRLEKRGHSYLNYYRANMQPTNVAKGNYQWLPFARLYSEQQLNGQGQVEFAVFNPGLLGTVHSITLRDEWVPKGAAKIIDGVYDPGRNTYMNMTQAGMDGFEGVNNKIYSGRVGNKLYWYQAFVQYNGADVMEESLYLDNAWMYNNAEIAWKGLIEYDLSTGTSTPIETDMPFVANPGAAVVDDEIVISGGVELVEQYVSDTGELLITEPQEEVALEPQGTALVSAAEDRISSQATSIRLGKKFLVERNVPGVRRRSSNPKGFLNSGGISINRRTGQGARIDVSPSHISIETGDASIHLGRVIGRPNGWTTTGGKNIPDRRRVRPRPTDPPSKKKNKVKKGLIQGARAVIMFMFKGLDLNPNDLIKVHVRARGEGTPWVDKPAARAEAPDYNVVFWNGDEWQNMQILEGQRVGDAEKVFSFRVAQSTLHLEKRDHIFVCVGSAQRTNARSGVASTIMVDYIYLEVEGDAYAYEYDWENMPQGGQAAFVVEAFNNEKVDLGVELKSFKLDIDSSKG